MALYHTYRPQSFDDVLGQPHVVSVLKSAIANDRVGHAYLMSGPRGVGKTSVARILAKAINCAARSQAIDNRQEAGVSVPCNQCRVCETITNGSALDVIEIDAASNRGIDEIRELRDRVRFAPTELAKKVYIIDEVHMLTKEAFNALLKTLEEPPEHTVFVLATTELQKIPETIFSRCQHFNFHQAAPEALTKHLTAIAGREGRTVDPEALELIVLRAEGSYRDALSAFEQVLMAAEGATVTAELVRSLLGLPAEQRGLDVLAAVAVGDRARILAVLDELAAEGVSLESFVTELIRLNRLLLLLSTLGADRVRGGSEAFRTAASALLTEFSQDELVALLERLAHVMAEVRVSPIPSLPIELALLSEAGKRAPSEGVGVRSKELGIKNTVTTSVATDEESAVHFYTPTESIRSQESDTKPVGEQQEATSHLSPLTPHSQSEPAREQDQTAVDFGPDQWHTIRQSLASQDASLAMLIADLATPTLSGGTLALEVPYKFHADRILSQKTRAALAAAVSAALGQTVTIECSVNPMLRAKPAVSLRTTVVEDPVSALSEL